MRYFLLVVGLTLVYAFTLASFDTLDLLFGAVLSSALVFASRRFLFGEEVEGENAGRTEKPSLLRRVAAFVPFSVVVLGEVVAGTWEVMLVTLHLRPLRRPGIVEVPIGERTPMGVAAWAVVTGLPPGSFFVDVDRDRGVVLIHVIDASDPDEFRRHQERFYRRYQSKVFP